MSKEKIQLSTIDVDVQILPNNTLDAYVSTPSSSGAHYVGVTPEEVGDHVAGLIDCLADAHDGMQGRKLISLGCRTDLREDALFQQFARYIERKRYNQQQASDSQDGLYSEGECREAEKWLSLFGVNLEYTRIAELIKGRRTLHQLNFDCLVNTDNDFVLISADLYTLRDVPGHLALWMTDNEEDEDNIAAYVLFVPELTRWSDRAKYDVLYAEGAEENPEVFNDTMAIVDGPKVVLSTFGSSEFVPWEYMSAYQDAYQALRECANRRDRVIPSDDLDYQSEEALSTILG